MSGKNWQKIKAALPAPCVIAQLVAVIILFLISLSIIAAEPDDTARTLHRGNSAEPVTLDPHLAEDVASGNIARDLFEGLTSEGPDGTVVPGLASDWEISADGKSYTFRLRDKLAWSSGDPLTANDIVYSLRRAVNPATAAPLSDMLLPISNAEEVMKGELPAERIGVSMKDDQTLVITLDAPAPWFLQVLSHPVAAPVNATSIAQHGDKAFTAGKLVSNGAYALSSWSPYDRIKLSRNARYHANADSWFDHVMYYPIDNNIAEFNRYRAGELDWTDTIPPNKLQQIRRELPGQAFISPYLGTYYYGFNLTREPFRNQPGLRRALSLAINREVIADKLLGNGELPAYRWLPPGLGGRTSSEMESHNVNKQERLSEAKRLYKEAGYGPGNPLRMTLHYNSSEQNKRIAVAISAMWKSALGIKTELVNEEWKVFLANRKGKVVTQAYRASWIADFNDASSFLTLFTTGHAKNDTGYSNPEYDTLVRQMNLGPSDERNTLIERAESLLLDDQVITPIYHYVSRHLVKPSIKGYQSNPLDHHYSRHLYRASDS